MNNHTPYTVLAILEAKPGKEHALKEALLSLMTPTLQEEGCLNYDLHQAHDNPAKFMFYENWVSKSAHAKHRETPHMKTWQAKRDDLLAKPSEVTYWEVIK